MSQNLKIECPSCGKQVTAFYIGVGQSYISPTGIEIPVYRYRIEIHVDPKTYYGCDSSNVEVEV
jgi:hypothetical protein